MPLFASSRCRGVPAVLLGLLLLSQPFTTSAAEPLPALAEGFTSQLPLYRAAVVLPAPRAQVLAALSDVPGLSRWLFLSDFATAIPDAKDPLRNWIHLCLKGMLGAAPQDAVLQVSRAQSADLRTITINLRSDASRLPAQSEYKRIEQLNVQFVLTTLGPATTRLEMSVQVLPAVGIPAMAMPFLGIGPQRSLASLQEVLASGRYSNPAAVLGTPRVKAFFKGLTI